MPVTQPWRRRDDHTGGAPRGRVASRACVPTGKTNAPVRILFVPLGCCFFRFKSIPSPPANFCENLVHGRREACEGAAARPRCRSTCSSKGQRCKNQRLRPSLHHTRPRFYTPFEISSSNGRTLSNRAPTWACSWHKLTTVSISRHWFNCLIRDGCRWPLLASRTNS